MSTYDEVDEVDENPLSPAAKLALGLAAGAAALGTVLYFVFKPKTASATSSNKPTTVNIWARVPDGKIVAGQRYRFSVPDFTQVDIPTQQALMAPFQQPMKVYGVETGIAVPADWPKDDPNSGANAGKFEAIAGANASFGASVVPLWQLTSVPAA